MPSLDQASIADLSTGFSGVLLRPDESGYDDARKIHNGMIDRKPGADCAFYGLRRHRRRREICLCQQP